jgi:hypothetical protein
MAGRPGKAVTKTKGVFGQPHTKGRPAGPTGAKPGFQTPQPGRDVIYNDGNANRNLWVNGGLDG